MATDKQVVVITGSSGRIGERLIEKLSQNVQPIGLDFVGALSPTPALEFVYVDLGSDVAVKKAFDRIAYAYGNHITSVVHLAAYYSFEGKRLDLYDKITVKGTERLLNECQRFKVDQFIFTSTMLVHNPTERGVIITEEAPIVGKWHYPASKVKTEHLIAEKHGNVPYVILRIAGCYDDECNCIPISQNMSRIFEKQLAGYFFPGNSNHGVPYIHFDDLVEMILMCIEKREVIPRDLVLLAAETDSISYRDLQTAFGRLIWGKDWPMIWIPKPAAKLGAALQGLVPWGPKPFIKPWMVDLADDNYEVSVEKAKKILGWTPKHSLRETLPKLVENMKKDPLAWYRRHKIPITHAARKSTEKLRKA